MIEMVNLNDGQTITFELSTIELQLVFEGINIIFENSSRQYWTSIKNLIIVQDGI